MKNVKRKNGKLSITLIAIVLTFGALSASAKTPYEFSIYGGGGYSFFIFRPYTDNVPVPVQNDPQKPPMIYQRPSVSGTSSSGASGDLGVGFTGFISPQVGLHVGLGLGISNIGNKVNTINNFAADMEDDKNYDENGMPYSFDLYTSISDYRETHRMFCLSIPLLIQFQSRQNQSWSRKADLAQGFYAMTGIKLNILFNSTYESKSSTLDNTAYYYKPDNWANTQNFAGLGHFKGKNANGDFGYIHALFTFEAGMKWRIADNMFLYTGAYFDYGLNDPTKSIRTPIADNNYIDPANTDYSLLEFSNQTNMMTVGVKVRLSFIKYFSQLSCPQFGR